MKRGRVIIISGLSGSGKSCAARALEDEGFFVVDNLPLNLLHRLLVDVRAGVLTSDNLAVVIDVRNREYLAGLEATLEQLRSAGIDFEIIFFDAADEVLVRRYSETRRRHPLARTEQVTEGIARERQLLQQIKNNATRIVDTSWTTPHQLRRELVQSLDEDGPQQPLAVLLQSFGYRYGVPSGSDLVMDVRFLPNPHFIPELQPLTGEDQAVREFVLNNPVCQEFMKHFEGLLHYLLPRYRQEGKSYLTVSIGCTGGRHRSVSVVEHLRQRLPQEGILLETAHRDIAKR